MDEEERQREIARLTAKLEMPIKSNLVQRAIARWILDFVRNCMVVAALLFLARKSGNYLLWAITIITGFSLLTYFCTYIEIGWHQFSREKIPTSGWKMHVGILLGTLITSGLIVGFTVTFYKTLDEIVSVQLQTAKAQ